MKNMCGESVYYFLNKLSWKENVDEKELTLSYQKQTGIELYSKPKNVVPKHVNCRCVIVPKFKLFPSCKKALKKFKSYQWGGVI